MDNRELDELRTGKSSGSCVLVMGSNEESSRELVLLLKKSGMEVVVSDEDSNAAIDETSFDAILIEEEVGTGGWELSSQIRNRSNIPIIVLGNSNREIAWVKAAAYGVDCYLSKPFNPHELVARVRAVVRRYDGTLNGLINEPLTNKKIPA